MKNESYNRIYFLHPIPYTLSIFPHVNTPYILTDCLPLRQLCHLRVYSLAYSVKPTSAVQ